MKKREEDEGLKYIRELSMRYENSYNVAYRTMSEKIGQQKVDELNKWFDKRANATTLNLDDQKAFYDFKNETLDQSLAVSGAFDTSFIRNFCNWIVESAKEGMFGNTILDVGCDCGVITCFLARCCPESKVTGIDRSRKAVEHARELAERLGVRNVEFKQASLEDCQGQYETVVCTRITQENMQEPVKDIFNTFHYLSEQYREELARFLSCLTEKVEESGQLILGDMIGFDPMCYGEIRELTQLHCYPVMHQDITYKQFGEPRSLNILFCLKTEESIPKALYQKMLPEEQEETRNSPLLLPYTKTIEDRYARGFFIREYYKDMSGGEYTGWEANLLLEDNAGKLIEGYRIYDDSNYHCMLSLWTNAKDPTAIFYFGPNEDGTKQYWRNMDASLKNDTLDMIRGSIKRDYGRIKIRNIKIAKLTLNGSELEEQEITINDIPGTQAMIQSKNNVVMPELMSGTQIEWRKH